MGTSLKRHASDATDLDGLHIEWPAKKTRLELLELNSDDIDSLLSTFLDEQPLSPSGSDGTSSFLPEHSSVPPPVSLSVAPATDTPSLLEKTSEEVLEQWPACAVAGAAVDDALWLDALLADTDAQPLLGGAANLLFETNPNNCSSVSVRSAPTLNEDESHSSSEALDALVNLETRTCNVCGKHFPKAGDLKRHALIHAQVRAHRCDLCERAFTLKGDLKRHVNAVHEKARPFECDQCHRRFPLQSQLRRHAVTHSSERPHECDVCHKRFTQSGDVARHKRSHSDERRFHCDRCGVSFLQKSHLNSHQKSRNCTLKK